MWGAGAGGQAWLASGAVALWKEIEGGDKDEMSFFS